MRLKVAPQQVHAELLHKSLLFSESKREKLNTTLTKPRTSAPQGSGKLRCVFLHFVNYEKYHKLFVLQTSKLTK